MRGGTDDRRRNHEVLLMELDRRSEELQEAVEALVELRGRVAKLTMELSGVTERNSVR